ncbi:uncharacterized protein EDB93DRAFT_1139393, partial [Suillus bovinus]|uniref:uncharacterized protein n=1 Tax=Suillus bovinus TaxID=48563 RepID=UPI001B8783C1
MYTKFRLQFVFSSLLPWDRSWGQMLSLLRCTQVNDLRVSCTTHNTSCGKTQFDPSCSTDIRYLVCQGPWTWQD